MKARIFHLMPSRNAPYALSPSSTASIKNAFLDRPRQRQNILRTRNLSTKPAVRSQTSARPFIPAPGENSGPLLRRLPDRALPSLVNKPLRTWLKTLPLFILAITISSLAMFNYQKSSSSTVNSILYALRTNPQVREMLGDEIYFASKVPWIRGELNQLHGKIHISFWVKGTKGQGLTVFSSERKRRDGVFETMEWSLKMDDGRLVQLLDSETEGAVDPFRKK